MNKHHFKIKKEEKWYIVDKEEKLIKISKPNNNCMILSEIVLCFCVQNVMIA